ncbi:MAG: DNA photolyase family protein [Anaerolineae bacterium]|nr:DNA photolyase family protein [Anaerolineae bacterium]MDW8070682.1 deoxyribodipyrimidine photo-lyase [Anaerolineae bacterium]
MRVAIWWLRRDLRLSDNQALAAALAAADVVLPVFILDPALLCSPYVAPRRLNFLYAGLQQLDAALRARGSYLILRRGVPHEVLATLVGESGAHTVYAEADYSPYAVRRDRQVAARVPLRLMGGLTVHAPETLVRADSTPYQVFTPFSRAWLARPAPTSDELLPSPAHIPTPPGFTREAVPVPEVIPEFPAGETEAQRRLMRFAGAAAAVLGHMAPGGDSADAATSQPPIYQYAQLRDRMDLPATSQLSPYLRFGMLSARQAVVVARRAAELAPDAAARQSAMVWLNELIWREFYITILAHYPYVREHAFRRDLEDIPWSNDPEHFKRWHTGHTGYPVVDAAMRQLAQSGWMHNRARMIVASFLVKDLLIDWRWGERWFMQQLLDGDPAANNGGWQWSAGTGTDAAPYFRIFNPVTQGQKFDPAGDYVRRWVPELARVPPEYVHAPWQMPVEVQRAACCRIGVDYPWPCVDHATARQRALTAYAAARASQRHTPGTGNRAHN